MTTATATTSQSQTNEEVGDWAICFNDTREHLRLPTHHHFGLYATGTGSGGMNSNSSLASDFHVDITLIKTHELNLPQSGATRSACENLHFHSDEEEDDHHPIVEVALETLARSHAKIGAGEEEKGLELEFPFMVLAVPLVGLIIIAVACVVGLQDKSRSMETLPSRYVDRRRSSIIS